MFKVLIIIFSFAVLFGCSDIALYDDHNPNFHNQKITFNVEMVYIPIAELTEDLPYEMRKYKYLVFEKSSAMQDYTIRETHYKTVSPEENFTIIKSYINKTLVPIGDDTRMIVLADKNGVHSISNIINLEFTNLSFLIYKEYLL